MSVFSAHIATRHLVPVCRQLAASYNAGIPILRAIEMVGEQQRDRRTRETLQGMAEALRRGATLGEAAEAQSRRLPAFFVQLLAAGERGGRLDVMLRDLADYFEQRLALNRKITGMMVYPALQLTFAWFLGSFALGLIARLNLSSTAPFSIAAYVRHYLAFQGGVVTLALAALLALWIAGRAGVVSAAIAGAAGHVPPFRGVVRKFALARFFRCLGLLLSAGLPVKASLENAARVAGDAALKRDVAAALPLIQRGATLSDAFAGARTLTPASREMLRVGEQSGKVDEMLHKAAEYHAAEAEHAVQVTVKLMNVLIVLAVAGVVGFIVISFYARYFGMLNELLR